MNGTSEALKTVAIIQARMRSTRLPGKILKDVAGQPMLARVVERARRARTVHQVVIATTQLPDDDIVEQLCAERGWPCFRGSEPDVLDRYYRAAVEFRADLIVRITSDCPLTDPHLIDEHVNRLVSRWAGVDFVTNMVQQTYPVGLAVEAMPADVLTRMKRMSQTDMLKEHVTTLAYEQPRWFRIDHILHAVDLSHLRWTVDTREDLELVRLIFQHFGDDHFSWEQVLPLLEKHPEWAEINRNVRQKTLR
jgi:spore coat polysaccharide biosynthesis protein SpsF